MKRYILFWLYFIVSIIFAIYFASRSIMTYTGHGKNTYIRRVSISETTGYQDLSRISAIATPAPGTKIYSINLSALNDRIRSVPGVKNVATRRRPDGNLEIRVQMHKTVALWTENGSVFYPLSDDGTIVNISSDTRTPGTVLFRGDVPDDIGTITTAIQTLIFDLDYLQWIEGRRWDIYTTGGIRIMLPEQDPVSAINTLINLNKDNRILARKLSIIDMRDSARLLVK